MPMKCNRIPSPHTEIDSQEKGTKKKGTILGAHTPTTPSPAAHTLSMSVFNYNRSIHSGLHIIAGYISLGLCVGRGFRGQSRGWDSSIWRSTSASQRSLTAAEFGHVLAYRMG